MARPNRGKEFEDRFAKDWLRTFPRGMAYRLKDDLSHRKGSAKNPCDFICFAKKRGFMLEVKSHYDNTFPFSNLTQYEKLVTYRNCEDVTVGVIIWFMDHDRIIFVDIDTVTKMMQDGQKSVNIRLIDKQGYKYTEIPSTKIRVFMKSDYSVLIV